MEYASLITYVISTGSDVIDLHRLSPTQMVLTYSIRIYQNQFLNHNTFHVSEKHNKPIKYKIDNLNYANYVGQVISSLETSKNYR